MVNRTSPRSIRAATTLARLIVLVLVTLVSVSQASSHERPRHVARQGSLTIPTVGLSTSTSPAASASGSGSGTTTSTSISPIATTTTELTTSIGPNGTSTFSTTITTLVVPGSTSGNTSGSATSTSTAFPSLSTYSSCVVNCLQLAVSAPNCSSITDTACYCASSAFPSTLVGCVTQQCNNELTSAENLAQSFCNLSSPSISLAFPAPSPSESASSNGTSTTLASASASASQSGAAVGLRVGTMDSWIGMGLSAGFSLGVMCALLC